MGTTQMRRHGASLLLVAPLALLCSCASKSEKEATALYHAAQAQFGRGEFDQTIENVTKALELTNDGASTFTISFSFYNGTIHLLRARAYDALAKQEEAIADYRTATSRGTNFLSSHGLNSDPDPGAKADWFRTLSGFYNSLGIACAKAGKYEDALEAFERAIGAASGSVNRVDAIDQVVGTLFGGEAGKRQAFSKVVGAYCYNVGLMHEKLGRSSDAIERAKRLGYDETLVVKLK